MGQRLPGQTHPAGGGRLHRGEPDIKVTIENTDWGGYWDKLATMTAGNNSPDVIQMDESYIAAYGARDALLDLGTVKGNLDLSAMDAKVLGTGKVEERSSAPRSGSRTSRSQSI